MISMTKGWQNIFLFRGRGSPICRFCFVYACLKWPRFFKMHRVGDGNTFTTWMQRAPSSRVASLCSSPDEECNRSKCFVNPMKNNSVKINLQVCLLPRQPVGNLCFLAALLRPIAFMHLLTTQAQFIISAAHLETLWTTEATQTGAFVFVCFLCFSFRSNPEICNIAFPSSLLKKVFAFTLCACDIKLCVQMNKWVVY